MDPISATSLVAGSIGVADVATRLGYGLRHLQQEFSGALDHVDNIAQQVANIDLAIREICLLLRNSSDTFPQSFESRLKESTTAIDKVVAQIQEHVQSVKAVADKSANKGKLLHLRHANKVSQWESNLGVQIQALQLLLQVAHMRSNDERTSVLEQDSSKRLFEKASSMSVKTAISACVPSSGRPCPADITTFSFDSTLLHTRVYRRACESSLRREILVSKDDINKNFSRSLSPVSSNDAIASQSGDNEQRPSVSIGGSAGQAVSCPEIIKITDHAEEKTSSGAMRAATLEQIEPQEKIFQQPSETLTVGTTEVVTESSDLCATKSTLATTMSSLPHSKITGEGGSGSNTSLGGLTVLVFVENVGSDSVGLPISNAHDPHNIICDLIHEVRDCVLTAGGFDPTTYRGSMTSCTIETSGQAVHKFPFTVAFLEAALEQLEYGLYSAISIAAQFLAPLASSGDHIGAHMVTHASRHESSNAVAFDMSPIITPEQRNPSSSVPHIVLEDDKDWPFSDEVLSVKGGFSEVYKANICTEVLHGKGLSNSVYARKTVAVKKLLSSDKEAFWDEVENLKRFSAEREHPHIINLLGTFQISNTYYLMFPWAEGNLRDYWRKNTPASLGGALSQRSNEQAAYWMVQQCAAIAEAIRTLHKSGITHCDFKPSNILLFQKCDTSTSRVFGPGTLKLADLGLAKHHLTGRRKKAHTVRRGGTPTYRPPEFDLDPIGQVSPAYDIWSLGCVYLEFSTWLVKCWDGVEAFRKDRRTHAKDEAFFINVDGRSSINPSVEQQLEELQVEASSFDPSIHDGLVTFLALVASCLVVCQNNRLPSETLAAQFKESYKRLDTAQVSERGALSLSRRGEIEQDC
ncbi:MAG: hypothetical protein Q9157_008951 [Trypethelium eluteriae]